MTLSWVVGGDMYSIAHFFFAIEILKLYCETFMDPQIMTQRIFFLNNILILRAFS